MTSQARETEAQCSRCGEPEASHTRPRPCRYNGWTNYETWAVKLWIDNDQGEYLHWQEVAREEWERDDELMPYEKRLGRMESFKPGDRALIRLSDRFKDAHEKNADTLLKDMEASVFADLLGAALSEVNWREIAEALLDEVKEASE